MNSLLVDEKGKIRSFNAFKREVFKVHKKYNVNYLQAEYQTAKASGQMARKWNTFIKQQKLYPNLKYVTVGDGRVREEHKELHGAIRPINDAFWDTHYPPNGWRCRCSVTNTAETITPKNKIPKVKITKGFENNVGKTGQIFSKTGHPYFRTPKKVAETLRQKVESYFAKRSAIEVRKWAKAKLVGKTIKAKDKPPFILSNGDVNAITGKPHKNRVVRNEILYNIKKHYEKAKPLGFRKEDKGRAFWKYWYYYELEIDNQRYIFNIGLTSEKKYKLHAISDSFKNIKP